MKSCPESFKNHWWEYIKFYNIKRCYRCGLQIPIKVKKGDNK